MERGEFFQAILLQYFPIQYVFEYCSESLEVSNHLRAFFESL